MTIGGTRRLGARGAAAACALALTALLTALLWASPAGASAAGQWVVLDSGRLGDYVWTVKTKRVHANAQSGSLSAERPCLLVGAKWQLSPFDFRRGRYRQCAEAPGPLSSSSPPLMASGGPPSDGPRPKLTAVGMIVAPTVRRVQVTFDDGSSTTVRAERLTLSMGRKTGLGRVRYAAFSVRGVWCAERIVSRSATGRTLWDSGTDDVPCSANGSPS